MLYCSFENRERSPNLTRYGDVNKRLRFQRCREMYCSWQGHNFNCTGICSFQTVNHQIIIIRNFCKYVWTSYRMNYMTCLLQIYIIITAERFHCVFLKSRQTSPQLRESSRSFSLTWCAKLYKHLLNTLHIEHMQTWLPFSPISRIYSRRNSNSHSATSSPLLVLNHSKHHCSSRWNALRELWMGFYTKYTL